MKGTLKKHTVGLADRELNQLFEQFAHPMMRTCITPTQKQSAVDLAKTLWLRLVTGTDTEANIYEDLKLFFKDDHDANIAVGSMYFFKMKAELTETEITTLKKHYSNRKNFNRLEHWEPSIASELH